MADQREVAFNFIKANGPVLPVQISKILNTNILFAAAVLSELVERKTLKMTNAAIGGSKLYYIPNLQEPLLGEKLFNSLNPVEKEVFNLLKESSVLRDKALEPKQRIALRDLKDFAFPLTITLGDQSEIFWKFHIVKDEDAKPFIQQHIEDTPAETKVEIKEQAKAETPLIEVPKQEVRNEQPQMNVNDVVAKLREELMKEIAPKLKERDEEISRLKNNQHKEEKISSKKIEEEEESEEDNDDVEEEEEKEEKFIDKSESKKPEGKFYKEILDFFNDSNIKVLKEEMVKKEKEYDFVVKIPSAFGTLNYFVKARDKKNFNDSDVALAFSSGQLRKLPTIFLGKGKLNKKAVLLIEEKLNGQLVFKEM